jgi:MFS family permease
VTLLKHSHYFYCRRPKVDPKIKRKKKRVKSIEKSLHATLAVMFDYRMLLFFPISLYSGYSVSVFNGVLPPIIAAHGGKSMISWVMILFFISEAIGSVIFGKLIDVLGRRVIMIITLAIHALAVGLIWLMLYSQPYLFFVTLFFCGLADSGYNTSIYSILGSPAYFKKKAGDAFAAFKLVQSIASAGGFLSSNFVPTLYIKIALSSMWLFAVLAFTVLEVVSPADRVPTQIVHEGGIQVDPELE